MAKLFMLHMVGAGEGCDHTIACNQRTESFKAKDWDEAEDKAGEFFSGYEGGETPIVDATLYEVVDARNLQVDVLAKRISKRKAEKERQRDLDALRALAAKLNVKIPELEKEPPSGKRKRTSD